jgi:protein involved in polysaccharide export with SLBB domain
MTALVSLILFAPPAASQMTGGMLSGSPAGNPLYSNNAYGGTAGSGPIGGSGAIGALRAGDPSTGQSNGPYSASPYGVSNLPMMNGLIQNSATQLVQAPQFNPFDYQSKVVGKVNKPAAPGEFELYVQKRVGRLVPRFGADLLVPDARDFAVPSTASTPPGYRLGPGDEFTVNATGSVQSTMMLVVDPDGRVFIPQVGPVSVVNVRYGDLAGVITRAMSRQFRDFRATVSMTRLQGVRVYVTGYANAPGAYTINSLSTLVNAMFAAGGPAAGGSFRSIQLYRNGKLVSDFDLYELIRKGDKSKDVGLRNEDVLYIPPVGSQIALIGSVNAEAIYEAKPGETIGDLLTYAGGLTPLADSAHVILYAQRNLDTVGGQQLTVAEARTVPARPGDIVQALNNGGLARPLEQQAVLVQIEGEVSKPGSYYVPPGTTLGTVIGMAGGLTPRAFVYGTQFDRYSVRDQQRESYRAAVDQLELSVQAAPLSQAPTTDPTARTSELTAAKTVLDKLRSVEPSGRLVLNLPVSAVDLPSDMVLENNDHLYIPPRPKTVGVFGAVYRPGSFEYADSRKVVTYLDRAGGPQRAADKGDIFVVHANGDVTPKRRGALDARSLPGDVVFVPVKTQSNSFLARLRDFSTILFGFGISAAAVAALTK